MRKQWRCRDCVFYQGERFGKCVRDYSPKFNKVIAGVLLACDYFKHSNGNKVL